MKSHRMPASVPPVSAEEVASVGADDRVFPGPVRHVVNHPVPNRRPVVKDKPGEYIAGVGEGSPVMHGVEPTHQGHDATEVSRRAREATRHVATVTAPKPVDPVPVYVVDTSGPAALQSWGGVELQVGATMTKALGKDGRRRRIHLRNTSTTATDIVRIGQDTSVGPNSGYPLCAGEDIDVYTQDALFLCLDSGSLSTTVAVGMFTEHGIPGGAGW